MQKMLHEGVMPRLRRWLRSTGITTVLLAVSPVPVANAQIIPPPASVDWRQVASRADRDRIRHWREAWTAGLARAAISHQPEIDAQGLLFNPDRVLGAAIPPFGRYRCRIFKLGAKGSAMAEFTAYPAVDCQIIRSANITVFRLLQGQYRPVGALFSARPDRAYFLGALILGDETRPMRYGRDGGRDVAGVVEQIEPRRWRLVMPYPRFESLIDVIEILPSPE